MSREEIVEDVPAFDEGGLERVNQLSHKTLQASREHLGDDFGQAVN